MGWWEINKEVNGMMGEDNGRGREGGTQPCSEHWWDRNHQVSTLNSAPNVGSCVQVVQPSSRSLSCCSNVNLQLSTHWQNCAIEHIKHTLNLGVPQSHRAHHKSLLKHLEVAFYLQSSFSLDKEFSNNHHSWVIRNHKVTPNFIFLKETNRIYYSDRNIFISVQLPLRREL